MPIADDASEHGMLTAVETGFRETKPTILRTVMDGAESSLTNLTVSPGSGDCQKRCSGLNLPLCELLVNGNRMSGVWKGEGLQWGHPWEEGNGNAGPDQKDARASRPGCEGRIASHANAFRGQETREDFRLRLGRPGPEYPHNRETCSGERAADGEGLSGP